MAWDWEQKTTLQSLNESNNKFGSCFQTWQKIHFFKLLPKLCLVFSGRKYRMSIFSMEFQNQKSQLHQSSQSNSKNSAWTIVFQNHNKNPTQPSPTLLSWLNQVNNSSNFLPHPQPKSTSTLLFISSLFATVFSVLYMLMYSTHFLVEIRGDNYKVLFLTVQWEKA